MPGIIEIEEITETEKEKTIWILLDYTLLFVLVFIVGFGLTMIYSTSSYTVQIERVIRNFISENSLYLL
ncbi:MAG: hypothetical protein ACLS9K_00045 [Lachnospira eligens]